MTAPLLLERMKKRLRIDRNPPDSRLLRDATRFPATNISITLTTDHNAVVLSILIRLIPPPHLHGLIIPKGSDWSTQQAFISQDQNAEARVRASRIRSSLQITARSTIEARAEERAPVFRTLRCKSMNQAGWRSQMPCSSSGSLGLP